ncbi:unnamed protein product [Rodentolepis nana]|uniref:Uncharacterized protein n=1 Tax=Rodentolepis nana TaxID=102285 RepID=A0A0R3TR50_RODNA|nr:unnamed protein product [Rodentolepis nana]
MHLRRKPKRGEIKPTEMVSLEAGAILALKLFELMASGKKWNNISKLKERRQRGGRVMGAASLGACLALNDSEFDKSPTKLSLTKRGSTNSSLSSAPSLSHNSDIGMKEQLAFAEGEQLAEKLVEEHKLTVDQVCDQSRKSRNLIPWSRGGDIFKDTQVFKT